MSNPLIDNGDYSYDASDPFEIRFSNVNDIVLPAAGTIVVPRAPSGGLHDEIGKIRGLNDHDWLFYSFLYPRSAIDPDENLLGYEMVFPMLRTANNHPFGISRSDPTIPVAGNVLCLVEQDYSPLDDLHPGQLFKQNGAVYSARYKENITNSSRAKVLIIHFDGNVNLPQTAPPISRDRGFQLVTDTDPVTENLRTALAAAPLAATVYAFDLAGHVIDSYSALLAYEENLVVSSSNEPAGFTDSIMVQFVDIHGQPLRRDELPLSALDFTQPLEDGLGPGNTGGDAYIYRFTWASDDPTRVVYMRANPDLSAVADDEKYKYRFLQAGYWPGFGFDFKAVGPDDPVLFDFAKDWPLSTAMLPRFVRFCVFHPGEEFQTKAGGAINEQGIFATNQYKLVSDDNQVRLFNTGDDYFADLAREIGEPGQYETVKAIYINNWKSHAHLFLHGKMVGHGIARNDEDTETVAAQLAEIVSPGYHIIVPLDPATGAGDDRFILMPQSEDQKETATSSFQVDIVAVTATTPRRETTRTHRGFARAGSLVTWQLQGENGLPYPHNVTASWKNSIGQVPTTADAITATGPIPVTASVPEDLLELAINAEDPPRAILKRKLSYDDLLCRLAGEPDGCTANDRYDDTGKNLQILFLHLESGRYEYIPLNPDPATAASADLVLHTFDALFAIDDMAVAIVNRKADPVDQDYEDTLITRFRMIEYSIDAFVNGNVPLTTEEWGGFLRQQIAQGVTVKALYWENHQANLSPGLGLYRGLENSLELTAALNRVVNGKQGFAMRDRATRPLGAFHQKGIVIVKEINDPFALEKKSKVVAYLGGMDMADSRWDTEAHHHLDPERMGGSGWHDVQMRIEGQAAIDVLRNFKQRWEALNVFEQLGDEDCRPINTVPNMGEPIPMPSNLITQPEPGHFMQITRTISPDSCFSKLAADGFPDKHFVDADGELGSLFGYLKAIANARKYILINDQYLFSVEITTAIHDALAKEDGPDFAIICLPKNLNESDLVDPMIYKVRKRALHALFYGARLADNPPLPMETDPQRYNINSPTEGVSVRDKVVVLAPINRAGDEIYVHSKQFIVDDSIMSVGSANFSFRGSSYEMEINGSVVGRKLVKGGTDVVREQRIEVCRRMLGLPKSYSTLLQDPYATFKIFKAVETESANDNPPTLNLHPLKPMVKQLDPEFVTTSGGANAAFDDGVHFVMATDENSPGFLFIARNVVDVDGRQRDDDATAVIAANFVSSAFYLGEFPRNPVFAYGRVTFDFLLIEADVRALLNNGDVFLNVTLLPEDSNGSVMTPLRIANFRIETEPVTDNLVIKGLFGNESLVTISRDNIVTVQARLVDGADAPLGFGGEHEYNPLNTPILAGSFTLANILMGPLP